MSDICLPNGSFVFGCSFDEMGKVICFKLLFQSCLVGSIKRDPLHWNSLLCIHNKVTPWGSTTAHLALHLSVVCMISKFTMFIYSLAKNLGSWHASSGVTWNLVSGHFTSARPKWFWHPKSTTLPSGEAPRIGMSKQTTKPLLRTFTSVFQVNIIFSYSWSAIGSCFNPCSTYREVIGFGLLRSAANLSWFLCLFEIK